MLEAILTQPWKLRSYARLLAELQVEMHKVQLPGMPSMREALEHKLQRAALLSDDLRRAALERLDSLPEGEALCHGDFHPGNVLLTPDGPVIIDWIDATRGSPLLDVTRSTLLMEGGPLPPDMQMRWLVNLIRRPLCHIYLQRYIKLNPDVPNQVATWLPLVAAARLDEGVRGDDERLLAYAQKLRDE